MINLSVLTREINCKSEGNEDSFGCKFMDQQGVEKEVTHITFFNHELSGATFESFKNPDTKEVVFNVRYNLPSKCEIMGTLYKNITVKCGHAY